MPGLGMGLGLSGNRGATAKPPSNDEVCAAISAKRVVKFVHGGVEFIAEPYALFMAGEVATLHAVVLQASDASRNAWEPQNFTVLQIASWGGLDATFIPSLAFNAADLPGSVVCSVDPV